MDICYLHPVALIFQMLNTVVPRERSVLLPLCTGSWFSGMVVFRQWWRAHCLLYLVCFGKCVRCYLYTEKFGIPEEHLKFRHIFLLAEWFIQLVYSHCCVDSVHLVRVHAVSLGVFTLIMQLADMEYFANNPLKEGILFDGMEYFAAVPSFVPLTCLIFQVYLRNRTLRQTGSATCTRPTCMDHMFSG